MVKSYKGVKLNTGVKASRMAQGVGFSGGVLLKKGPKGSINECQDTFQCIPAVDRVDRQI